MPSNCRHHRSLIDLLVGNEGRPGHNQECTRAAGLDVATVTLRPAVVSLFASPDCPGQSSTILRLSPPRSGFTNWPRRSLRLEGGEMNMRLILLGIFLLGCVAAPGCAWWKNKMAKDDEAASERMTDSDMSPYSNSRSLTERSSLPGGWSSEARAIEANLGVR